MWTIVMFYQLFGLSFWRHPFTAQDPLVSKRVILHFSKSGMAWGEDMIHGQVRDIILHFSKPLLMYVLDGLRVHVQYIFIYSFKDKTKEESHCQTQTVIRCRIDYMHFLKYKTIVKAFHADIVLIWPTMDKLAELMDVVTSEMIVYITTSYHIPLCNMWVPSDPSLCRNQSQQIAVIWVSTNVTSVIWLELFPCYI